MTIKAKTLKQVDTELARTEAIFDQGKKKLKKAKGRMRKYNQKRALDAIGKAVDALAEQKEIIKSGAVIPAT